MAELNPSLVGSLVISGSILAMTDSISEKTLAEIGFYSSSDLLLPTSVKGLKALLSVATHKRLWFPDCLHKDYLEVMFKNRKKRGELLEGLVVSNKDTNILKFPQKIHLLWGENDVIFKMELAHNMEGEYNMSGNTKSRSPGSPGETLRLQQVSQAVPYLAAPS